ncbi:MAG: DUF4173 domain-containing protein [Firmicutes bacterium]|nr:DUF4173 domain-containing protein [Bacillota bacterium]
MDRGSEALLQVPETAQRAPFSAAAEEIVFSLVSFLSGWCYANAMLISSGEEEKAAWYMLALAGILVFSAEYIFRGKSRSIESWLLLSCFIACTVSYAVNVLYVRERLFAYPYQFDRVWDGGQMLLFIHLFFVWYVLSRSGKMLEGKTGHLLPVDMADGFVIIPFGSIFLRIRTLVYGIRKPFEKRKDEGKMPFPWMSFAAVLLSMVILVSAVSLLMDADETFSRVFNDIYEFLSFEIDEMLVVRLIFSIPVGAWLWGLIGGSFRCKDEVIEKRKGGIYGLLEELKKVDPRVWTFVIILFSAVYAVFFVIQGNYLFSAFRGRLPEGFIVSEYARRGFFELCKVMALNFLLLWMATRSADERTRESKAFKAACVSLLIESMLFSAVSVSKLGLYISSFGLTPLRVQSSWLAAVLFMGCALWMYSLLTEKKVFRYWMYFGAVTLTVLAAI